MTREPLVDLARRDRVLTITLRADRLSEALAVALERAAAEADDARDASIVIFRGLASLSPSQPDRGSAAANVDASRKWIKALARVERLATTTLAVIDGTCSSVGLEIALTCNHRIATARSRLLVSAIESGNLPGLKTFELAKFVGAGMAARMLLLGEPLSASEAVSVGLVDRICSPEELTTATEALATQLLGLDGDVARLTRQLLADARLSRSEDLLGLFLAAERRSLARKSATAGSGSELMTRIPVLSGGDFHVELQTVLPWLREVDASVRQLDPNRSAPQNSPVFALRQAARTLRSEFFARHSAKMYAKLAAHGTKRLDGLVYAAAEDFPGLLPTREYIASLTGVPQKTKDDAEVDQALFVAELLRQPDIGSAIIDGMRTAKPESFVSLNTFQKTDRLDLGVASLERRNNVGYLSIANRACLNAEDDTLLEALEIAADVALLDNRISVCVLRGDTVDHAKYRGRRVFCSGINLTHLYEGRISYLYFVQRELGFVNKLYRGLRTDDAEIRKPWVMAVEGHAIGGGSQLLLVSDYVLAERGAQFSVPAQHEGFIPGAANLRLARFVGPRVARELIHMNGTLTAERAADLGMVDEVVEVGSMDEAIARATSMLASTGPIAFAGNHRMIRLGEEPDGVFRDYMAQFARDQALALFRPELINNLEQHWLARKSAERASV
jgi:(3,5-dihydroxyphenyl)acetyl-CoA 1,2-dioxygenase